MEGQPQSLKNLPFNFYLRQLEEEASRFWSGQAAGMQPMSAKRHKIQHARFSPVTISAMAGIPPWPQMGFVNSWSLEVTL